jgi:hypothetical protein
MRNLTVRRRPQGLPAPAEHAVAEQQTRGAMSPVEQFLAPCDNQQIVLVERYNLALVVARPRRALPQDPSPADPTNNGILRTTGRKNA